VSFKFRISGPPGGRRGQGPNMHQKLPWTDGDVRAKFFQIGAGVWISIGFPHTNRQTSVLPFMYI